MVESQIYPPEEVLGPKHNPQEGMDPDDREYMLAETGELAKYWENAYEEALTASSSWEDFRQRIADNAAAQEHLKDSYDDTPVVQNAVENINYIFGTIPSNLIDGQANIILENERRGRGKTGLFYSEQDLAAIRAGNEETNANQSAIQMAEWHDNTIWALLRYGNGELIEPKTFINSKGRQEEIEPPRTLPDILIPALSKAFKMAFPNKIASRELGITLTGLYGPVRVALAAEAAGLISYVPPPLWDVDGKVDLILGAEARRIFPTQVKSTRRPPEFSRYLQDAPAMEIGGRDIASREAREEWQTLDRFCELVRKSPSWQTTGVEIIPTWVTIYGAQANTAGFKALFQEPDPQEVQLLEALKE